MICCKYFKHVVIYNPGRMRWKRVTIKSHMGEENYARGWGGGDNESRELKKKKKKGGRREREDVSVSEGCGGNYRGGSQGLDH